MGSGRGGGGEREELHQHGVPFFEWPGKTMDDACPASISRQAQSLMAEVEMEDKIFPIWPLVSSIVRCEPPH